MLIIPSSRSCHIIRGTIFTIDIEFSRCAFVLQWKSYHDTGGHSSVSDTRNRRRKRKEKEKEEEGRGKKKKKTEEEEEEEEKKKKKKEVETKQKKTAVTCKLRIKMN